MRRRVRGFAISIALLIAPAIASAADAPPSSRCPICSRANNQAGPYPEKAVMTLVRGMTNTTFGWTELLTQPSAEVEHGGNLAVGIGRGIGYAMKRTAVGFGEMFTFWVPKGANGYPALAEDCPICSLPAQKRAAAETAKPSTTASSASKASAAISSGAKSSHSSN